MTDTTNLIAEEPAVSVEMMGDVAAEEIDEKELAERLLAQAREQGVSLVGPGGLLSSLTKTVLETALEAEMSSTWATSTVRARWGRTSATAPGSRRC